MKSLTLFFVAAILFGLVSLGLAYGIWGPDWLLQAGVAFALTFVPATATFAFVLIAFRSTPDMMLLASLGGTGVRMAIVLGGGLYLTSSQPELFANPFWGWLVLYYLVFLTLEITLLVRRQPSAEEKPKV